MKNSVGLQQDDLGRLFCDITYYLDARLNKEYARKGFKNYLIVMDKSDVLYIRYPNDITGAIYLDEDSLEITSIVLYKKAIEVYRGNLEEKLNELYVGKRLV